jgi:hypothetical protein
MAKKLVKTGIKRDKDHMYYIKAGAVWAAPMKRKGKKAGKKTKVVQFCKPGEMDYSKNIYFVDKQGDVAVAARGRKKAAKKTAKKKSKK